MTENPVVFRDVDRIDSELVSAFARLDVATVYESLTGDGLLGHEIGSIVPGGRACGPAVTAHNAPGDNLAMHVALDMTQQGDVLVIKAGSPVPAATWGGLATEAAVARGLAGVVTDGYVRDVALYRERGFPVWARGISPRHAEKAAVLGVNVPVTCAGATVCPGDLVLADDDGAVVVRAANAAEVLARALERLERETADAERLATGATPFALYHMERALQRAGIEVVDGASAPAATSGGHTEGS